MSPDLRRLVMRDTNKLWAGKIPYLKKASWPFMLAVSEALTQDLVAQQEAFGHAFTLYILCRGLVLHRSLSRNRIPRFTDYSPPPSARAPRSPGFAPPPPRAPPWSTPAGPPPAAAPRPPPPPPLHATHGCYW